MKKLIMMALCLFVLGGASATFAQDPVKPVTEKAEEKKECKEEEKKECTEEKKECCKQKEAEEAKTEKTAEEATKAEPAK